MSKYAAFETTEEVARSPFTALKVKAMTKPVVEGRGGMGVAQTRKMKRLYGTASVNGTHETAESINTNDWPIRTCM